MIRCKRKKYWVQSTVVMETNRIVAPVKNNPSMHFPRIGRRTRFYFIQAISFLLNIKMVHSLRFMEAGTGRHYRKPVFALYLFLSKMESLPVIMKCLQVVFLARMY